MERQGKYASQLLRPCNVVVGKSEYMGFLYMRNEHVVVLLNNLVEKADLGPLRSIRHDYVEPKADILIFPYQRVDAINILEMGE